MNQIQQSVESSEEQNINWSSKLNAQNQMV